MTVAVVEPSPGIRRAVLRALRPYAGRAEPVLCEPKSLRSTLDERVAAVVIGWSAEHPDALDRVREIRSSPEGSQIPVLVVSAFSTREDARQAAEAGVTEMLLRPFTAEALRARLERHLPEAPEGESGASESDGATRTAQAA